MTPQNSVADFLAQSLTDNLLGGSTHHEKASDSLATALETVRAQEQHTLDLTQQHELHSHLLSQEVQKTRGLDLKNQQTEFKIELEKVKAQQAGLSVPSQDPQPQNPAGAAQMVGPKWPSDGEVTRSLLTTPDSNPSKGLVDAITTRMQQVGADKPQNPDKSTYDYMREELMSTIQKVDTEKNLAYTPFGRTGGLLGGLLDIVSGGYQIGTTVFGGKAPPAVKAELLTRALSSSSPLVTAELRDMFNRDKMEQTAQQRLSARGLGSLGNHISAGDQESADYIGKIAIDMRKTLQNDPTVKTSWSSDATTGIGEAYNQYENIQVLMDKLRKASTKEEVFSLGKELTARDEAMREPIRKFVANGRTPEQIHDVIVGSINAINKQYQKPLQDIPGDAKMTHHMALQGITAKDFTDKLADFESAVMGGIPLDIETNMKRRIGDRAYAKYQELQTTQGDNFGIKMVKRINGKYQELVIADKDLAPLLAEASGKPGLNPNKLNSLLSSLPMLASDSVEKLRQALLVSSNSEQHSAINKAVDRWIESKKPKASDTLRGH